MKTFNDSAGRTWTVDITIDAIKRVKNLLKIDLLQPERGDPPLLTQIGTDEILLCDVIYCLIKPQADQLNVSDEDFGRALGGEAILAAQTAFYEELIDFFRRRGRTDRAQGVAAQKKVIDLAIQKIDMHLASLDLETEIDTVFGDLSGSSPASSESTRGP